MSTTSLNVGPSGVGPSNSGPLISGPSFLGLDKPGPTAPARETKFGHDAHTEKTSGNLDYLLEDDEEPKSGAWKVVLILGALALALGFGYLRWRNGGMDWLTAGPKKPAAAAQTAEPASGEATSAESSSPNTAQPAAGAGSQTPEGASPSGANAALGTAPATGTAPAGGPSHTPDNASSGAATSSAAANVPPSTDQTSPAAAPPGAPAAASEESDNSAAAPVVPVNPKPIAKPPAKPVDTVKEAEKYIYGRGVRQDCGRGMKLLRPAAEHSNARAMASLGVLYSAGLCTPRDLPTGYRWIALALRKEPDNQAFKDDLQKLWGEMTQPERQLAIKMSQ